MLFKQSKSVHLYWFKLMVLLTCLCLAVLPFGFRFQSSTRDRMPELSFGSDFRPCLWFRIGIWTNAEKFRTFSVFQVFYNNHCSRTIAPERNFGLNIFTNNFQLDQKESIHGPTSLKIFHTSPKVSLWYLNALMCPRKMCSCCNFFFKLILIDVEIML